jgi:uncharacterized protein with PIN domain
MPSKREELKSAIMKRVEELVEASLKEGEKRQNLSAIEDQVLTVGREVNELLTHGLVAQQDHHRQAEQAVCGQCGQRMQAKGKKRRYVRTRSGEVAMERNYYYCPDCQQGVFPPG